MAYVWSAGGRTRVHIASDADARLTRCGQPVGQRAGDGDAAHKGTCDDCCAAAKRTVLLADDEPMMLRLLHRLLDSHEHATIVGEATTGVEALDLWRKLKPDVIVLDQMMPGLTGLEVAEVVLAEHPAQQIILFTALARSEVDESAQRLGITACVAKTEVSSIAALMEPGALAN